MVLERVATRGPDPWKFWLARGAEGEEESTRRVGRGQFHKFGAIGKFLASDSRGMTRIKKILNPRLLSGAVLHLPGCARRGRNHLLHSHAGISTTGAQEMQKSSSRFPGSSITFRR